MVLSQLYFLIFLAAAVISAPLAMRFGLGTALGYLLAGVLIGPLLSALGVEIEAVLHISEYGITMMLFLIGLELEPEKLWNMRRDLIGAGTLQVIVTSLIGGLVAYWVYFPLNQSIAIGLILSLSSTAVVLQSLNELGLGSMRGGKMSLSVLLLQDIAVIFMLAALPFLGFSAFRTGEPIQSDTTLISHWSAEARSLVTLLVIALIILAGRNLVNPLFRYVAKARLREVFTAAALLLVILITTAMNAIGLSPALGAFLGGVVLSNSEFRHQIQHDIGPFKGLLLSAFFIAIGASIDFTILFSDPLTVFGLLLLIVITKIALFFALGLIFRLSLIDRLVFAFGMAQLGEFSLVLLSYAGDMSILSTITVRYLTLITALSMLLTPGLFIFLTRYLLPRFERDVQKAELESEPFATSQVIVAGSGRFGQIVVRQLRAQGFTPLVIDYDVEHIESMKRLGFKVFYGDASDFGILAEAGAARAELLIIALSDLEQQIAIITAMKSHFPHVRVMTRAHDRTAYYRLRDAGADVIMRDLFGSANYMSEEALKALGMSETRAASAVAAFRKADEAGAETLYHSWKEENRVTPRYFETARSIIEAFEETVRMDNRLFDEEGRASVPHKDGSPYEEGEAALPDQRVEIKDPSAHDLSPSADKKARS